MTLLGKVDDPLTRVSRLHGENRKHSFGSVGCREGRPRETRPNRKERQGKSARTSEAVLSGCSLFEANKNTEWSIGGERYAGLTSTTELLGEEQLGIKGLYDTLSAY